MLFGKTHYQNLPVYFIFRNVSNWFSYTSGFRHFHRNVWLVRKKVSILNTLKTPAFDFYSVINEPKINVTNFTVKPDNFHETRQINKTLITNLSMSAIKEIKAKTINPVIGTQHFMISAYKDYWLKEMVRVIAIVLRSKIGNLFCHLCDHKMDSCNVTKAEVNLRVKQGSYPYFNYSFAAILCDSSKSSIATKVRIANSTRIEKTFLHIPIRNIIKSPLSYNFTVCLSQIFKKYNDAPQFVQTMEMYKILGVQRVAIYNISWGDRHGEGFAVLCQRGNTGGHSLEYSWLFETSYLLYKHNIILTPICYDHIFLVNVSVQWAWFQKQLGNNFS